MNVIELAGSLNLPIKQLQQFLVEVDPNFNLIDKNYQIPDEVVNGVKNSFNNATQQQLKSSKSTGALTKKSIDTLVALYQQTKANKANDLTSIATAIVNNAVATGHQLAAIEQATILHTISTSRSAFYEQLAKGIVNDTDTLLESDIGELLDQNGVTKLLPSSIDLTKINSSVSDAQNDFLPKNWMLS